MPLINIKVIEGVFSPEQKTQIIRKLTDSMVAIEGEAMRAVTWTVIDEVRSGDWGIAGKPLTTADVIRSLNGEPMTTLDRLRAALKAIPPGAPIVLQIQRDGKLQFLAFTLE